MQRLPQRRRDCGEHGTILDHETVPDGMSRKEVRNQTTLHRTQFRVQHKTDLMRQQGLVRYGLTAEYQMFKTHLDELK